MATGKPEHTCVVGLAWGDEGKGKIVDLLGERFDVVVRYNGGANAGHTIIVGNEKYAVHLLPTGLLRPNIAGVIGPGVVVDPVELLEEIDALANRGIDVAARLRISDRAHVVMPYHKIMDSLSEAAESGKRKIGTTARGIGPCYSDKMLRSTAVRMADLTELQRHRDRIKEIVALRKRAFAAMYGDDGNLSFDAVWESLQKAAKQLLPMISDTSSWLRHQIDEGKSLFFEGANGMLLDVDHGTYPYVTSSNTGPQGVAAGAGVPEGLVKRFVGVTKSYTTRVGSGPFPSELSDAIGDSIRDKGHEYGTTTGRPRRCGWLDAVAIRASVRLGGVSELAVTHLDTLSGFNHVGICVGYELDGNVQTESLPAGASAIERVKPVIEMLPGWTGELGQAKCIDDLPANAIAFVRRLEELVGAPVTIIGVGAEREQTITCNRLN